MLFNAQKLAAPKSQEKFKNEETNLKISPPRGPAKRNYLEL
jgi:hypothetical protein